MFDLNMIKNSIDNRNFYISAITILFSLTIYFKFKKSRIIIKEVIVKEEVIKEIPNATKKRSKVNNPENFRFKIDRELAIKFDNHCKDHDISRPKLIERLMVDFFNNLIVEDLQNPLENSILNENLFLKIEEINLKEDIKETENKQ